MPIDYYEAPGGAVKKPGDFKRKGTDGPPYVPSLTKTRQPTGKKAELVAKAEERGIDATGMTVAQLKEALGPEPADDLYGRPSGFGDPLENSYSLRKWIERGIAAGVVKLIRDGLNPAAVDLDDDAALDRLVADAQDAVEAMIWADRGTHAHRLIEVYETGGDWLARDLIAQGEVLGIAESLQRAIVESWRDFRAAMGLRSVHTEIAIVNDGCRVAGTADLVDVAERRIVTPFGVVEPGDHVIGDIKTGDARDKYAVQIAAYRDGVPYDVDAERRLEWEVQAHPSVAFIYHMSMKAVLDGAPVIWEAIPVDLAAGREGARICCEARDWPTQPVFGDPITKVAADTRRIALRERKARMESNAEQTGWLGEFRARWSTFGIGKHSTDDEIERALDAIEPPFDPNPQPVVEPAADPRPVVEAADNGGRVAQADIDDLVASIKSSTAKALVNAWLVESRSGDSWDVRYSPHERHYQITAAALRLAEAADRTDAPDDFARTVIALVMADVSDISPAFVVGETLNALSIDEARRLSDVCVALGELDGAPSAADVVAVLAAA
jgi:hypothetical protein